MTETIDFYFDVGSPASYLAWTQLPALAERTGAEIRWKPMLLGGVFKEWHAERRERGCSGW